MINSAKFKGKMVENNYNYQTLAPVIKCTPYILGRKIANENPMTLEEAMSLSEALHLTKEEFSEIFLSKKLQKATKTK